MHLIQILLPLTDDEGKRFPSDLYQSARVELTERFKGLTAYTRAPAEGIWKADAQTAERDDIVIYEVMTSELDRNWWAKFKRRLESAFEQESIIVRSFNLEML